MRTSLHNMAVAWQRFWFTPAELSTLAAIRICTGLILFYVYLACTPSLMSFIGPHSWIDPAAIDQLRQPSAASRPWWGQSLYFHVQHPALLWSLHLVFMAGIVCFTLGLFSRVAGVIVWVGHLCFIHRAYLMWSGMDTVLAMLTFYMMLAPVGGAWSLDQVLRRRAGKPATPAASWSANFVIRLIQIHMCIIYLCAGLSKLQGSQWWDGTAVWRVMMLQEFAPVDVSWLGHAGDGVCLFISSMGVLLTLAMEISFPYLIWNRTLRPVILSMAFIMHMGIGLFMGMSAFGAAMLTGCLAFLEPALVNRFVHSFSGLVQRYMPRRNIPLQNQRQRQAA